MTCRDFQSRTKGQGEGMTEHLYFNQARLPRARGVTAALFLTGLCLATFSIATSAQDQGRRDTDRKELIRAEQPPAPCFPNETAAVDVATVARRGDIVNLPEPLETRILQLAARPHTYLPIHAFAEADKPSLLFQYYLLDTNGFQPNIFTSKIQGLNDSAVPTAANEANCGQPTIGSVRLVVEPKPGLPTDA